MEQAIQWYLDRKGRITYSMDARLGPNSYDCSSAVYLSLKDSGRLPASIRIGNTDSLFGDLERNGWERVSERSDGFIDTRRGDVFIWGRRGVSGGAAGHTGEFINADDIIHCAYGYNGIAITNHDWLWGLNGRPEVTVYRYTGATQARPVNAIDQVLEIGSLIKFSNTYIVDDMQLIGDIWQVRTNDLCKVDFTWEDNGIPVEPLVEVDDEGYATPDQELAVGSKYKLLGRYEVLDLVEYAGNWLAQIQYGELKFWIDIESATEIPSDDVGTPIPPPRPPTPPPVIPIDPVVVTEPIPEPSTTPEQPVAEPTPTPTVQPDEPTQETPINNPKEDTMAFNPEDQEKLKIATEKAQEVAQEVSEEDEVKNLVGTVSEKTKLRVYIIGDALIGLGIVSPGLAIVAGWNDVGRIVALSSVCSIAGAFILTMFGIYKSNK